MVGVLAKMIPPPKNAEYSKANLREEWRDDGTGHLFLTLQLNLDQNWISAVKIHPPPCQPRV